MEKFPFKSGLSGDDLKKKGTLAESLERFRKLVESKGEAAAARESSGTGTRRYGTDADRRELYEESGRDE